MDPMNFFAELRRRNVYRVAVAYAIIAWLLVQIATQTFPFFAIPMWAGAARRSPPRARFSVGVNFGLGF